MAQRLRKNHDFLKLLVKCTPAQRKAILKAADYALVRTICECVFNVLKETVPVSKPAKRKLLKHKKALTALAEKSTPLNKKKQILVQHGGNFLSVLVPPVLRVSSSLLSQDESYKTHGSCPWKHSGTIAATPADINTTCNTNSEKSG